MVGNASICMTGAWLQFVNRMLILLVNAFFTICVQLAGMDTSRIGLFDLAEKRLTWAASRQTVLASNIANANTPGYKARDVESFQAMLSGTGSLTPVRTQAAHLTGTDEPGTVGVKTETAVARSIDGNAVSLDQQLTKVADTETTESLVTTIWKKYVSFFNLALGKSS